MWVDVVANEWRFRMNSMTMQKVLMSKDNVTCVVTCSTTTPEVSGNEKGRVIM